MLGQSWRVFCWLANLVQSHEASGDGVWACAAGMVRRSVAARSGRLSFIFLRFAPRGRVRELRTGWKKKEKDNAETRRSPRGPESFVASFEKFRGCHGLWRDLRELGG